ETIRLKDLFNVTVEKVGKEIEGRFAGMEVKPEYEKIQWVTEDHLPMVIIKPDLLFKEGKYNEESLKEIGGFVERNIEIVKEGEVVQMERFGFVKIERLGDRPLGIYVHR
ncbi:MAG: glutamate--tRNA ligase, partial [Thermoplasmata archaeon]